MKFEIRSDEIKKFAHEYLNDEFFTQNVIGEFSAARLILLQVMNPEFNELAMSSAKSALGDAWQDDIDTVSNEDDFDKLYSMLRKGLNPEANDLLIDKLLKYEAYLVMKLIADLKKSGNDILIENAAKIIAKAANNYTADLLGVLDDARYPYAQSVICLVLGMTGTEEAIIPVYNYYEKFNRDYVFESYDDGPLAALYLFKDRFVFN